MPPTPIASTLSTTTPAVHDTLVEPHNQEPGGKRQRPFHSRICPGEKIHRRMADLKKPGKEKTHILRWGQAPLGSGRSPARTCRPIPADGCARLCQTLCSIRCSQGGAVSRPIALPVCKLLDPAAIFRNISAVCSRRPAASEIASESRRRSPGGISGPAGHPARRTRASSRGS